ncbi:MAG: hypothetical protein HRU38_23955 [Saccharospirillaceae bacterium]|nr:hypothetical protein [Pseudomonadales bacterium]NRB81677.1 hypothetical protein [Saccharospirillaceae bacterium]
MLESNIDPALAVQMDEDGNQYVVTEGELNKNFEDFESKTDPYVLKAKWDVYERSQWRNLTPNEIVEAKKAYGTLISDYKNIKIYNKKWFFLQDKEIAMTPNGHIYWPAAGDCADATTCKSRSYRAWFIHEMGHVMQYQNGQNLIIEAGMHQMLHYASFKKYDPYFKDKYDYLSTPSPTGLNPEAQADWYMYDYLRYNP